MSAQSKGVSCPVLEFGVVQFQAVELEQQDIHGYFKAHI